MVAVLSLLSVAIGVALACVAERYPAHVAMLERGGGTLMIVGLALAGSALPHIP